MHDHLPANTHHFTRLFAFARKVFALCVEHEIDFVIYGSLALFAYTGDEDLAVRDVDIMVPEKQMGRLHDVMRAHGLSCERVGVEVHVRDGDLLVEVDGWGLGIDSLRAHVDVSIVDAFATRLPLVSLDTLERIYALARDDQSNADLDKIRARISLLESFLGRPLKY